MENIKLNLPPFYVGQKVVAIENHSQGAFKKDESFAVRAVKKSNCCGRWHIDIGLSPNRPKRLCTGCNAISDNDASWWFFASRFAPLEERFISLAEVIKIESPLTCVN